ncbi:HD domain-containing protein [Arcanobacterium phocae]|uniref:HD domain-containing protein n=1 Tax=Arcanobacterium phocae TaxID=131112 RepID=UPI001C0E9299|nr:HD domain-containing protein [Arcanobacterium phocae]
MSNINWDAVRSSVAHVYQQDSSGHGMDHIDRVVSLCQRIIADTDEPVDTDVILMSAYVHDMIDPKVVSDPARARQDLTDFLHSQQLSDSQIAEIFEIIDHMSFAKNLTAHQPLNINGQIVQDADRLDAIGAIGIARAFYYGGKFGDPLYDPARPPRDLNDETQYRVHTTVINHFYEKLFRLTDSLNTPVAQRIGELRNERMRSFVVDFISEWNGKP